MQHEHGQDRPLVRKRRGKKSERGRYYSLSRLRKGGGEGLQAARASVWRCRV